MALLITPENLRPRFTRQPAGSFANPDLPTYGGARPIKNADNTWTLCFKDGTTWSFNGRGWLIGQTERTGNALRIQRVGPRGAAPEQSYEFYGTRLAQRAWVY